MAAELGLLSLSQLRKLAQQQHAAHLPVNDDDDPWEVQAFARDTTHAMGTTWPPRSYTCTFCRREFRSAQALGGHMNVHRRDRARLRHSPQVSDPSSSSAAVAVPSPPMIFPSSEFVASGGVFFYPVQTPAGSVFVPATEGVHLPASSSNRGASLLAKVGMARGESEGEERSDDGIAVEELDLELRLGW